MRLGIALLVIGVALLIISIPFSILGVISGVTQLTQISDVISGVIPLTQANLSGGVLAYTGIVGVVVGLVMTGIGAMRVFKQ